jgi:hypothetical protein
MDESGNSNEIKMIKSTLCFNKNPNDFSDIPLPNFSEKHLNYYQKIQEEHKSMMESDSEIELKNIISAHHKSINDYKNQNNCELVYSEEPINNENINSNSSINVSYEELLDMVNIKEPLDKNASKNYIYKNHNPNNELLFSSNFESGNLRYAIKKNINEYDLILRHETGSIKTYQWFYFRVAVNEFSENYNLLKENPIVKFNIINLYKKHIILNNRVRVLTFYNNAWSRDTSKIYYYTNDIPFLLDSNDNNKCTNKFNTNINESFTNIANNNNFNIYDIIMNMNASKDKDKENNNQNFHTLTFQFDLSKINTDIKYVYFAYCYPYTYTQLTNYLFSLSNYKKILRIDSIGQSLDNNKLYMLIITNFEDSFDTLANKKAIIFTARVHPGESSSSFVIQGLIEFLLSNETKAISLRKNYIFKIIPMLNPDGVIRGNFRMNSVGKDLNRMWMEENEENSPSVFYCHKMIQKTLNSRNIHFFCDFHGHSSKNNFFLYSCKSHNEFLKIGNNNIIPNPHKKKLSYIELIFQEIYSKENIFFDKNSCINKILPSKIKTARAVLKNRYNIDYSYCLETSLGGAKQMLEDNPLIPFSIQEYKKIGKDFGEALGKMCVGKIYYSAYNSVRINENRINLEKKTKKKSLVLPVINNGGGGMINLSPNYLNFCRINSKNHNYNKINIQYHQKESNKSNNNFLNNNLFNKCDQRILKNKNIKNNTKRNNKNKTYEKSKIYIFSAPEKIVKK